MQYDTAGNPMISYDQCAYCNLDTGGNHAINCPCNPNFNITNEITQIEKEIKLIQEKKCAGIE
jgi:hypothetical protein